MDFDAMTKDAYNPLEDPEWPLKAYKNWGFLNSSDARTVRVLCEFLEPASRFSKHEIHNTITFLGSARTLPPEVAEKKLKDLENNLNKGNILPDELEKQIEVAKRELVMSRYYADAVSLAEKLTKWSMTILERKQQFVICSGGGPGIMEASNRGAHNAGGRSIGLNISLVVEQEPNPYITKELMFDFHYFFVRKFWFVYLARAMVVFPGGYGTIDELFELLTLLQTGKTEKKIPVVLYGNEYWSKLINFRALVEWGTISPEDLDLFHIADNVDDAFQFLKDKLTRRYL